MSLFINACAQALTQLNMRGAQRTGVGVTNNEEGWLFSRSSSFGNNVGETLEHTIAVLCCGGEKAWNSVVGTQRKVTSF